MKIITEENLKTWRRHLHQNPELSLKETTKTKEFSISVLDEYGIDYKETLETGLVIILNANNETKDTVLYRADIDALPIQEENNIDFKSQTDGVMHACGHDGHTTMLLGSVIEAADYYKNNNTYVNSIFVFQPAEENEAGGMLMYKDNAFGDWLPDEFYGLHVRPDLKVGDIATNTGTFLRGPVKSRLPLQVREGMRPFHMRLMTLL